MTLGIRALCPESPAAFPQPYHGDQVPTKMTMATWEQWRTSGHDTHSIRQDPRLIDRDGAKGPVDLRLRPDSPAAALGIQSVDVRDAGLLTPIGWGEVF